MSRLSEQKTPQLPALEVRIQAPASVIFTGTITSKDPSADLMDFFKAVHRAAKEDELSELTLDVSGLTFVNSSTLRLFVDWATWVKASPSYKLRFMTSRKVTWQKTSLLALNALAAEVLTIHQVD